MLIFSVISSILLGGCIKQQDVYELSYIKKGEQTARPQDFEREFEIMTNTSDTSEIMARLKTDQNFKQWENELDTRVIKIKKTEKQEIAYMSTVSVRRWLRFSVRGIRQWFYPTDVNREELKDKLLKEGIQELGGMQKLDTVWITSFPMD